MLKNKLVIKKVRNIIILLMAIMIIVGIYTNIKKSRAENVIEIQLEISDKSEMLQMQTITMDATETKDGIYLLDLPKSVNGNIVTKYYTENGTEVSMNDENADKTLTLTQAEIDNLKVQLQTDYDKKEVTTEDGQIITLYNKELLEEKKEDDVTNETTTEMAEENTNEETNQEANEENKKVELDDTVIVTGYMPLEAQVNIQEIDSSTLSDVQLSNENQTIQNAYDVSIYKTVRRIIDVNGNIISEETIMPNNVVQKEIEGDMTKNTINNELKEDSTENISNNELQEDTIKNITSENARENENVVNVVENLTSNNTLMTVITLKDGTQIEEEKIECDLNIYNEKVKIKTKNTQNNVIAQIYKIMDDNNITEIESAQEESYITSIFEKDNKNIKYLIATEPKILRNTQQQFALQSNAIAMSTNTQFSRSMLRNTSKENYEDSDLLGISPIERQDVDQVEFTDSISDLENPKKENLIRSYNATYNTGTGHNNSTTSWKDITEHQDGAIHGATWSDTYLSLDGVNDWVNLGNVNLTEQVTLDITIELKSLDSENKIILCNYQNGGTGISLIEGKPAFNVYVDGRICKDNK